MFLAWRTPDHEASSSTLRRRIAQLGRAIAPGSRSSTPGWSDAVTPRGSAMALDPRYMPEGGAVPMYSTPLASPHHLTSTTISKGQLDSRQALRSCGLIQPAGRSADGEPGHIHDECGWAGLVRLRSDLVDRPGCAQDHHGRCHEQHGTDHREDEVPPAPAELPGHRH